MRSRSRRLELVVMALLVLVVSCLVPIAAEVTGPDRAAAALDGPVEPTGDRYSAAVMTDEPSAYYRFEETSGQAAIDELNNQAPPSGHDGTYASTSTRIDDGALYGSDPTDRAEQGSTNDWDMTAPGVGLPFGNGARSLEVWVRTSSRGWLMGYGSGSNSGEVSGLHVPDPWRLRFLERGSVDVTVSTPVNLLDGQWHQVAVTYSGGDPGVAGVLTFFVDGVVVAERSATLDTRVPSAGLRVGGAKGAYDEAAVYPVALDEQRIGAHAVALRKGDTSTEVTADSPTWVDGEPVTFTAQVTPGEGTTGIPAGSVAFYDGFTQLGAASLAPDGSASLTVPGFAPGNHSVTAVYEGDLLFVSSVSPSLDNLVEGSQPASVTLDVQPEVTTFGKPVVLDAAVASTNEIPDVPTGFVTFYRSNTVLGTAQLVDGQGTLIVSDLPVGVHDITVTYGGDMIFASGQTGESAELVVGKATPTAVVVSSRTPSASGENVAYRITVGGVPEAGVPTGTVTLFDSGAEVATGTLNSAGVAVVHVANLELGTHALVATYGGDARYAGVDSEPIEQEIEPAATMTSLTANYERIGAGRPLKLNVKVATRRTTLDVPTGSVEIVEGTTTIGTVLLDGQGQGTLVTSELPMGSHRLVARYFGDSHRAESHSTALLIRVLEPLTISLDPLPAGAVSGASIPLSAHLSSGEQDLPPPTGVVSFKANGVEVARAVPQSDGHVTTTSSRLVAGSHAVVAEFLGDAIFAPVTSTFETITVGTAGTTLELTAASNPVGDDTKVQLRADVNVAAPGSGRPTGFVTFRDGLMVLGSASVNGAGQATLAIGPLSQGIHDLSATYGGDENFDGSLSEPMDLIVDAGTATNLTATPNPVPYGTVAQLEATVTTAHTGIGLPRGIVEFAEGSTVLGSARVLAGGTANLPIESLGSGEHQLVATFQPDPGWGPSTSSTVTLMVDRRGSGVTIEPPSPVVWGQRATLRAHVQGANPTGFVTFTEDSLILGTAQLDGNGAAELSVRDLSVGTHSVVASYGGDANFDAASASPVQQVVVKASAIVTVDASANPVQEGSDSALHARVVVTAPGNGVPTGTVSFIEGSTTLGTEELDASGRVTLTAGLGRGSHEIVAVYSGDGNVDGAQSDVHSQVITASTSVDVAVDHATSDLGDPLTFSVQVAPSDPQDTMPTGGIALFDGSRQLAAAPLDSNGSADVSLPGLPAGTHQIVARYLGDEAYAPAISDARTVDVAKIGTTLTIEGVSTRVPQGRGATFVARLEGVNPAATAVARPGGSVSFSATGTGGTFGSHTFAPVGVDANGVARFTTASLPQGTYEITASYEGDTNYLAPTSMAPAEVTIIGPLSASFDLSDERAPTSTAVHFDASHSTAGATDYAWDFGDGTTANGAVATHTYTAPGVYTVTLRVTWGDVHDQTSRRFTAISGEPLTAIAGDDRNAMVGQTVSFDGSSSRPEFGIDEYTWDFGDGSTSVGPRVDHRYMSAGTFTTRLTVHAAGETHSTFETVTVFAEPSEPGLHITVTDTAGAVLQGVNLVVIDPVKNRFTAKTDAGGEATIQGLANAHYQVYAVTSQYLPASAPVDVESGEGHVTLKMTPGEAGVTRLESHPMSPSEIAAAGIDTSDPDNLHVVEFEIWLAFFADPVKVHVNSAGRAVGSPPPGGPLHSCDAGGCRVSGGGYVGRMQATTVAGEPALTWIVMPGAAKWLKEFFEVSLTVVNAAGPEFAFEDAAAHLDLPSGLSLASTTEPQSALVELGDIPGGQARTATWVVRGDDAGSYDLTADVSASLYPVGTSVQLHAEADQPLVVYGSDALKMVVDADDEAVLHSPYIVRVGLQNVSPVPVNGAAIEFFDDGMEGAIYQPRQRHRFDAGTIAPGTTFWTDDLVLVPQASGYLNLEKSFVKWVEGSPSLDNDLSSHEAETDGPELHEEDLFMAIGLNWDPIPEATGYQIFATANDAVPFPFRYIVDVPAGTTSYELPAVPGDSGLFAIRTVYADGTGRMLHNAVEGKPALRGTASVDVSVECGPDGSTLKIDYFDSTHPVDHLRISLYPLDGTNGTPEANRRQVDRSFPESTSGHLDIPLGDGTSAGLVREAGLSEIPTEGIIVTVQASSRTDRDRADEVIGEAGLTGSDAASIREAANGSPQAAHVFRSCRTQQTISADATMGRDCTAHQYMADGGSKQANPTVACRVDPVNTATGNLVVIGDDVSYPGAGTTFAFDRTYNSRDSENGPLGVGWSHPYAQTLSEQADGTVRFRSGDGKRLDFEPAGSHGYVTPPGSSYVLDRIPTGGWDLWRPEGGFTHFDSSGHLAWIHDMNGIGLTVTTDSAGNALTVTDHAGRTIGFSYSGGLLSGLQLPDGNTVSFGYSNGRLVSVGDVRGGTTTYGYDAAGLLNSETDANGHLVHATVYGADGRVTEQTDALGNTTTFAWDAASQTSTMVDARGGEWVDVYDDNRLIRSTDPLGRTTARSYDDRANVSAIISPSGATTSMSYNEFGQKLSQRLATGGMRTWAYNTAHRMTRSTDALGTATVYSYDTLGRLLRVDGPGDRSTAVVYNADGQVVSATDGNGSTTSYRYDAFGNVAGMVSPLGHETTFSYNTAGRVVSARGATGGTDSATMEYDEAGNLTAVHAQGGLTTQYSYDAVGNMVSKSDTANRTVTWAYNAADELVAQQLGARPPTVYAYDGSGNQVSVTSPTGAKSSARYDAAGQMIAKTDPLGNRWTYGYDADGNLVSIVDPDGSRTSMTFDPGKVLVATADASGGTTRFGHDPEGNVTSISDPLGRTATRVYDASGNVVSETDVFGRTTTTDYDAVGRPTLVATPSGATTTYRYDADGNLTSVVDPRAAISGDPDDYRTVMAYDEIGNLTQVVDPLGNTTTWTYDAAGDQVSMTDANSDTTEYQYDVAHRLTGTILPGNATTTVAYDDTDLPIEWTDPVGGVWSLAYDADGRQITEVSPGGAVTAWEFDAAGNRRATVDPLGRRTTVNYRFDGQPVRVTEPGDRVTSYTYDVLGRLTTETDPTGAMVRRAWDAAGQLVSVRDAAGNETSYVYEAVSSNGGAPGRSVTATDALGAVTVERFDADDRLIARVAPSGLTESWTYDPAGNPVSHSAPGKPASSATFDADNRLTERTDPLGSTTAGTYDGVGNLLSVTDPLGATTRFSYDARGNRTSQLGADGGEFSWGYDLADRIVTETTPGGAVTSIGYDVDGNPVSREDGSGRSLTAIYDAAGQLTNEHWVKAGADSVDKTYTYDAAGFVASMSGPDGVTGFERDAVGRPIMVIDPNDAVVRYGYERGGQVGTVTYPDGSAVTHEYDAAGRLTGAAWPNHSISISRDADGQPLIENLDGTKVRQWAWDADTGERAGFGSWAGTDQRAYLFANDDAGRLSEMWSLEPGRLYSTQLSYDAAGQLTGLKETAGINNDFSGALLSESSFTYDQVGQRTSQMVDGVTTTYEYGPDHEVTLSRTGSESTTYSYDGAGRRNLVDSSDRVTGFAYDASGAEYGYLSFELLGDGSSRPSGAVYRLDAVDRVVGVHDARPWGESDYSLVWDAQAGVSQVLAVDSGGLGDGWSSFRFGVDRVAVDGVGGSGVFGSDVYGNAVGGDDAAGDWVQAGLYSVFGEAVGRDVDAGGVTFGFGGELVLPSGEVDLRARTYDPVTGGFLQPDPLVGVAGTPTVSNRYQYADNDPVNSADPLGLRAQGKHKKRGWLSIGAGVVVGGGCVVLSGGTLTPGCVGLGMAVYSGVDSYQGHCLDGQAMTSCLSHVAMDAGIGFVEGYVSAVAFEAVFGLLGGGLVGMTAAGGAGAFTQSGISQVLRTGHLDAGRLARDAAIGAATGGLTHGLSRGVSKVGESFASARQAAAARAVERQVAREAAVLDTVDQTALRAPALARIETGAITTRPTRAGPTAGSVSGAGSGSAARRASAMLDVDRGYNISPERFFSDYPTIGRSGTFLTDAQGVSDAFGASVSGSQRFSVHLTTDLSRGRVSFFRARSIERALGLERGSLRGGFRLTEVTDISSLAPRSPLVGNQYFVGPGRGLPNGAPELVVDSIKTTPWPP